MLRLLLSFPYSLQPVAYSLPAPAGVLLSADTAPPRSVALRFFAPEPALRLPPQALPPAVPLFPAPRPAKPDNAVAPAPSLWLAKQRGPGASAPFPLFPAPARPAPSPGPCSPPPTSMETLGRPKVKLRPSPALGSP